MHANACPSNQANTKQPSFCRVDHFCIFLPRWTSPLTHLGMFPDAQICSEPQARHALRAAVRRKVAAGSRLRGWIWLVAFQLGQKLWNKNPEVPAASGDEPDRNLPVQRPPSATGSEAMLIFFGHGSCWKRPWNETWQHKPTPSNTNLLPHPEMEWGGRVPFRACLPEPAQKWMAFRFLHCNKASSIMRIDLTSWRAHGSKDVIIPIYSHHASTNWHVLSPHTLCCTVVYNDRPISSLHGVLVPTTQNGEYITVSWLGLYHPFIVQDSPSLPPWRHLCIASAGSCTVFQGCGRKWWLFQTTHPPSEKISTWMNSELATIKQRTSMQLGVITRVQLGRGKLKRTCLTSNQHWPPHCKTLPEWHYHIQTLGILRLDWLFFDVPLIEPQRWISLYPLSSAPPGNLWNPQWASIVYGKNGWNAGVLPCWITRGYMSLHHVTPLWCPKLHRDCWYLLMKSHIPCQTDSWFPFCECWMVTDHVSQLYRRGIFKHGHLTDTCSIPMHRPESDSWNPAPI